MTGKQRGVGPVNHLWAQVGRDKQSIRRAPTKWRGLTICLLNLLFYMPSNRPNHTERWKDSFWFYGSRLRVIEP